MLPDITSGTSIENIHTLRQGYVPFQSAIKLQTELLQINYLPKINSHYYTVVNNNMSGGIRMNHQLEIWLGITATIQTLNQSELKEQEIGSVYVFQESFLNDNVALKT